MVRRHLERSHQEVAGRVYMRHVRMAGYCARGAREFCKQLNHDWSDFLDNGVDADILERTGDAMALKVVAAMHREQQ